MQSDTLLQCIQRTMPLCEMQLNTSHDLSTIGPGLFGFYLSYDVLLTVVEISLIHDKLLDKILFILLCNY